MRGSSQRLTRKSDICSLNTRANSYKMSQECLVCVEPVIVTELACRHDVHLRCIAMSGQNVCPVCRQPVQFTQELELLYQSRLAEILRERAQQQTQESAQLARELHRQEQQERRRIRDEDEDPNQVPFIVNHRRFRVTLTEQVDGPTYAGDLMLAINQIMIDTSERNRREFTTSPIALRLFNLIIQLNSISAESGLSVSQLCSVIENTQS